MHCVKDGSRDEALVIDEMKCVSGYLRLCVE